MYQNEVIRLLAKTREGKDKWIYRFKRDESSENGPTDSYEIIEIQLSNSICPFARTIDLVYPWWRKTIKKRGDKVK